MLSHAIIILAAIAATAVWLAPDILEWCITKLAQRRAYILAGRQAAKLERQRMAGVFTNGGEYNVYR